MSASIDVKDGPMGPGYPLIPGYQLLFSAKTDTGYRTRSSMTGTGGTPGGYRLATGASSRQPG
ncbi:hypothetical protein PGTUg99_025044 [Puccinia graminis f. sp. tritici]|uniref:Uncharacterized protein n=1 Tax=Puccinia graminis f. sp. tritici TaxID=56615 RepID=A0A5B0MW05_PUCGR|nr:hypothetical protein PGTUg99_025044 [Puccinia graminis f. sp. tritici]